MICSVNKKSCNKQAHCPQAFFSISFTGMCAAGILDITHFSFTIKKTCYCPTEAFRDICFSFDEIQIVTNAGGC